MMQNRGCTIHTTTCTIQTSRFLKLSHVKAALALHARKNDRQGSTFLPGIRHGIRHGDGATTLEIRRLIWLPKIDFRLNTAASSKYCPI